MGQPQFMPSSYLTYAVDFDGDGRRDIWDSKADVFGSVANYLARNGWRHGEPWIQPVRVPGGFSPAGSRRAAIGARSANGCAWASAARTGRRSGARTCSGGLLLPTGAAPGEGYIVYANGNAIRRYNPSDFYMLAVGLLGNAAVDVDPLAPARAVAGRVRAAPEAAGARPPHYVVGAAYEAGGRVALSARGLSL